MKTNEPGKEPRNYEFKMKQAFFRAIFVAAFVVGVETFILGWSTAAHAGSIFVGIFLGTLTYWGYKAVRGKKKQNV
jgi:hypothetical protein